MTSSIINERYVLQQELGRGGMGGVFVAQDRLTHQQVALKRIQVAPRDLRFSSQGTGDERVALAREFQMLATLRHPQIISVLDYGFDAQQQPFFTMELLTDARPLFVLGQRVSLALAYPWLVDLLQALAYLHRRGILHRDLKPENILLLADGRLKVLDFGLAVARDLQGEIGVAGTLDYMAPEVLLEGAPEPASDLYAVGVLIHQLLTGAHPFPADSTAEFVTRTLTETPNLEVLMQALEPNSPAVRNIVSKLLIKNPADRYPSALAVLQDLATAMDEELPPERFVVRESFLQAATFVGRETELHTLQTAYQQAAEGTGQGWLIGGESGVGKSRLLDELRNWALVQGALVLRGDAVEQASFPYQLWRDAVRRLLLTTELSDLEAGVLKAIVPEIDTLLGHPVPDVPRLSGTDEQQRLSLTIIDLFRRQTRPMLLLLEDLQWTGESLVVLQQLNKSMVQMPLLIVATYRDDERPDMPDALPSMQTLMLPRLTKSDIGTLAAVMMGQAAQQDELVDMLDRQTEGNVFFLVEVVRALAEDAGHLEAIPLMARPDSVLTQGMQTLLQRRLERVSMVYQPFLELAAVAGRYLQPEVLDVLRQRAQIDFALDDWLYACAEAAVLEVDEGRWRFRHDKLRETVLARVDAAFRPNLHRQVAEAIEAVYVEKDALAQTLLEHWRQVGDPEKEYKYCYMAADYMLSRTGEFATATNVINQGLTKVTQGSTEWIQLSNLLAIILQKTGNLEQAETLARHVMDATHDQELYEAYVNSVSTLGIICHIRSDFEQATDLFKEGLAVSRRFADMKLMANMYNNLGINAMRQKKLAAAYECFQQSLVGHWQLGITDRVAKNLLNLGGALGNANRDLEAVKYIERARTLFGELGMHIDVAKCNLDLGSSRFKLGQFGEAAQSIHQSYQVFESTGDRYMIAYSLHNLGRVYQYGDSRDYQRAMTLHHQALEIFGQLQNRYMMAWCWHSLGRVNLKLNNFESAAYLLQKSREYFEEFQNEFGLAWTLLDIGTLRIRMGEMEQAQQNLLQSLKIHQKANDIFGSIHCLNQLGEFALRYNEPESAQQYFVQSLQYALKAPFRQLMFEAVLGLAQTMTLKGETQRASYLYALLGQQPRLNPDLVTGLNHAKLQSLDEGNVSYYDEVLAKKNARDFNAVVEDVLTELAPPADNA